MIKMISKKEGFIIQKDSNKLGFRKLYPIYRFLHFNIDPGITLYIKSIEDLEIYKNEKIWCIGTIKDEDVCITPDEFTEDFEPILNISVDKAIDTINNYYRLYKHSKFILLKSINKTITIPKIDF